MASFVEWLLTDVYALLIQVEGMGHETEALYNTLVISVTSSISILLVASVIQAFFNLFGAFFNAPKNRKK